VPGGEPLHDERQRLPVGHPVRQVVREVLLDGGLLGVAAVVGEGDDPAALGGAADDLGAGHHGQRGAGEVGVLHGVRVGVVDPCGGDVEQQLPGARDRVGQLGLPQHFGAAELGDLDGAHAGSSAGWDDPTDG
jgi:hypothetical protein